MPNIGTAVNFVVNSEFRRGRRRERPLAVCGCNLTASTAVQWNAVGQTTSFVSSNQLNASIPAGDIASIGLDNVTVAANSEVSAPQTFFVGSTGGNGYAMVVINQQANNIVSDR